VIFHHEVCRLPSKTRQTLRETTLHYFVGRIYAMLYMRCSLVMAAIIVAPYHITLYKLALPLRDPGSNNRPTCHSWAEKLGPTIPHSKRHLDRFSCFAGLTAVNNSQTEKQTNDARSVATTGHSHLTLRSTHQPPACIRDPASISTTDLHPGFSSRPGLYSGPGFYLKFYGRPSHRVYSRIN